MQGYAEIALIHQMCEHVKSQESMEFEFQAPYDGKQNGRFSKSKNKIEKQ